MTLKNRNKNTVYFRVDGGSIYSVAMGHVYRCLKIARYLSEKSEVEPVFLIKNYSEGVAKADEHNFRIETIQPDVSNEDDLSWTKGLTTGGILFVDVRHFDPNHIGLLRENSKKLILLDDLGDKEFRPHVLVNPSVLPKHYQYPETYDDVEYCLGPRFFILGKQEVSPVEKISTKVETVLVSLGGADPANYSMELLKKTYRLHSIYKFQYIIGPAYQYLNEFKALVNNLGLGNVVDLKVAVPNLPSLMVKADVAIVAGGDSCLELAWSGTPGMIAPTISYEEETAEYLHRQRVFESLGDIKNFSSEEICSRVSAFANDFQKRKELSANGRQVIDGQGIERLSKMTGLI